MRWPATVDARGESFLWFWMRGLSLGEGLPGRVPPCGQGGSLRDGGGELMGGSRGGGCLNIDDSVWLLWEDFSSGLGEGTR